jgi:hypothetical protein
MATPPISPEKWMEAHRAVQQHGSVFGAAKALNIPGPTLEKRYARALSNGMPDVRHSPRAINHPALKAALIERPHFPSAHEDIETFLSKREEAYRRKREAHAAKQWARYVIKETGPFGLVFVGDPHLDDDGCDVGALRRDLELMDRTPGLYGVGLGDWVNAWTGRLSRLYAQQSTTEHQAFKLAEWMLDRPSWLLLLRGNHDLWAAGSSALLWMRTGGAPLEDWEARFEVGAGGIFWRIWAAHDFPGNSMWNKVHAPMRRAQMGQQADLYVCGHKHSFAIVQDQDDQTGHAYIAARARGYKGLDSYARQLGYGAEGELGRSIAVICDPGSRRMTPFPEVPEAADYLTWLRGRA